MHVDLRPIIKKYRGLLVVGDVHANFYALAKAYRYSMSNNLFMVMLGDLVDGMEHPMETILLAKRILDSGSGALVIGNHDDKFYRLSLGNKVKLSAKQEETLSHAKDVDRFLKKYADVINHSHSDMYHVCDRIVMVHAAAHHGIWELPSKLVDKVKAFALYGSVTGEKDKNGFPIRTYEWIDDIPSGHSVIAGHARDAIGKRRTEASMRSNSSNGTAYFIDTSCGKQSDAPLSGVTVEVSHTTEVTGLVEFYADCGSR
jgi:protein phosphatase